MELNFGVGNKSLDLREIKPHGGNIFISYQGYTDNNALYGVSYSQFEYDVRVPDGQDIVTADYEYDTLTVMGGYAFSDPSEGAFFIKAKYLDVDISVSDGVNTVSGVVDQTGFVVSGGYFKQSNDGLNWSVELQTDISGNDIECLSYDCTAVIGDVDFQIPDSNWNFGLEVKIAEDRQTLNIGPSVKF
tara:strand:- start:314 stop:877 length:564 start_codon:yes stop_codon:yes gene_type:complete